MQQDTRIHNTRLSSIECASFGPQYSLNAQVEGRILEVAARGMQLAVELAGRLELPLVLQNIISLMARNLQPLDNTFDKQSLNLILATQNNVRHSVRGIFEAAKEHAQVRSSDPCLVLAPHSLLVDRLQVLTAAAWIVLVEQAVLLNRYGLVTAGSFWHSKAPIGSRSTRCVGGASWQSVRAAPSRLPPRRVYTCQARHP